MDNRQLQLCNFEQSEKLKELGFDIPCRTYWFRNLEKNWLEGEDGIDLCYTADWGNNILRPTVTLAIKWLRDEKRTIVCVGIDGNYYFDFCGTDKGFHGASKFEMFEQAESAGLDYALNYLLKTKGNG